MGNYLIEETSMLMGIKDELEELKSELMCIQGYLKDVETREREDEASKVWTKLVLDIAYDVEDVLDSYNLKAEERSQRRGLKRLTNKIGEKMDAYNILDDIRTLRRRILDVTRKRETYGIGNFNEPRGGGSSTSSKRVSQLRRARSVEHEELVVGLEDDAKILLEKLLDDDGDQNRYMISIFGMGGLGKTALARKLYNSGNVKTKFYYRAWISVSQEYKTRDMLLKIIRSLGVTSMEELEKIRVLAEEDELEVYLFGLLEGGIHRPLPDVIGELIHLRYLGIAETFISNLPDFISNLRFLQTLDASGNDSFRKVPTFKLSSSSEEGVRFQTLVELTLRCDIRILPKDMNSIFPTLESLRLVGLHLEEDPMHVLKKLQRLENVVFDSCEYSGVKMSISEQGFGRLRKLAFYIDGLEELQIEEEAMPSLMELKLRNRGPQIKLMIPDRLRAFLEPLYTRN
ncbi:hypothetical protein AALP_AAs59531U000200 [Arabis alpina]|uniref:Uncharacterized protein n=1 Tax=Arabis alpina TaxID=50452 RepID=A0A087FWZ6_ARAAL|nr:hypothetical protein AALP_AAs59531U000200 [Arabis alpina]